MADVVFTYDGSSFTKGMEANASAVSKARKAWQDWVATTQSAPQKVAKDTERIADAAERAAGGGAGGGQTGVAKNIEKATGKLKNFLVTAASSIITMAGIGIAAKKVWGFITGGVPEVQQAFGVVKDIFMRNFFYPIRQFILPYLVQILNWTRDHRAMFVQWGNTAVNILKSVALVVKPVWEAFKGLFAAGTGQFSKTMDLFTAKLALASGFLGATLATITRGIGNIVGVVLPPLLELLGKIGAGVWSAFAGFIEGLAEGAPGIAKAFGELGDAVGRLSDSLGGNSGLANIGKWFGKETALLLQDAIGIITTAIDLLSAAIDLLTGKKVDWNAIFGDIMDIPIVKGATGVGTMVSDAIEKGIEGALSAIPGVGKNWAQSARNLYLKQMKAGGLDTGLGPVRDAVIQNGRVIRTDVNDTIIATRNPGRQVGAGGGTWTVYLNVTEGNARRAGEKFTEGMQAGLRTSLLDHMVREGQ